MTNTSKFSTAKEVSAAIASLGLTSDVPALAAIARHCKVEFLACLSQCVQHQDPEGRNRSFIQGLLKCLDAATLARLQDVVAEATIDSITLAARKGPVRLLSALDAAQDHTHPRQQDAVAFLRSITGPSPVENTSTDSVTVPSSAPAPAETENPRPLAPLASIPATPTASQAPQQDSYRVYGSSFALCFNASDWNATPGVRVDAALSNGPRSYDWKNALHVGLSPIEVAAAVAVFRHWRKALTFDAQGSQNAPSFALEFQGSHYVAKVTTRAGPGKVRAVKILSGDATAVSILFLKQLGKAYKGIPMTDLLATVRATQCLDNAA